MKNNYKIYFFPEGKEHIDAASRYRCFAIYKKFRARGISCEIIDSPFAKDLSKFFILKKFVFLFIYILKKYFVILRTAMFDGRNINKIFFFQRGITIGFVTFLKIIKKLFKIKMVFDFDDAIFHLNFSRERVNEVIRISDIVIAGSHYLHEYAMENNIKTFLVPTTVDTQVKYKYDKPIKNFDNKIVIGWIGSLTNMKYLQLLVEPLCNLAKKYPIELLIIGPKEKRFLPNFKSLRIDYIVWNNKTEINDLLKIDIGVMPLFDSNVEKGKCAFKAIQYMALGIPVVCSNIGENKYLIEEGANGFLASSAKEWQKKIELLINDIDLRKKIASKGKKTIQDRYSLEKNSAELLQIIEQNLFKGIA